MKQMNRRTMKVICCVMAGILVCSGISAISYGAGREAAAEETLPVISARLDQGNDGQSSETDEWKVSLDETVYVIAEADGSVEKVISSDWLQTGTAGSSYEKKEGQEELPVSMQVTYILDGKQISAEEAAGASGDLTIRFDYQNQTEETVIIGDHEETLHVPFAVLTGVILDSEKVSRISITNGKLLSDGDRIIAAGLAFPGLEENLQLAERSLTDGKEGITIPDYVEISAHVTDFEMASVYTVATNELFKSDGGWDPEALEELQKDMEADLEELTDAMDQLTDGSGELYDGVSTLYDKSGELTKGVQTLYDGASSLRTGADALKSGASELQDGAKKLAAGAGQLASGTGELQQGAEELANGLSQLAANNEVLNAAAEQVFAVLLNTANNQLQSNSSLQNAAAMAGAEIPVLTIENYGAALDTILGMLDAEVIYQEAEETARQTVAAKIRENTETIQTAVEQAVREQVTQAVREQVWQNAEAQARTEAEDMAESAVAAQVTTAVQASVEAAVISQAAALTGTEMTVEQYHALLESDPETVADLTSMIEEHMASTEVQEQIAAATAEQMTSEAVQAQIAAGLASEETQARLEAGVDSYMEGEGQAVIQAQMASDEIQQTIRENTEAQIQLLISQYMGSEEVLAQIRQAVETAKAGAGEIAALKTSLDSYQAFYQGLLTYTAGVAQASAGAGSLRSGASQLNSGAYELSSGAKALADGAGSLSDGTVTLAEGAGELADGVGTLKDGAEALIDGVGQLRDGAGELHDGIIRMNEEGIQKLTDLLEGDTEELLQRIQASLEISDQYQYSDAAAEKTATRLIIKTAAIR